VNGPRGNCRVGIVDYQAGNIHSIDNAFASLGARTLRVRRADDVGSCTHLVLPGVGAFGFCTERLAASGLTAALRHWVFEDKHPMLGICVGMQMLADSSEESPEARGLGWVGGSVRRIAPAPGIRVPHVGWNSVKFEAEFGEFGAGASADFYFDHSFAFHQPREGMTLGHCDHGESFSAVVRRDNLIGAQFHPEKSQSSGMRFLRAFLAQ
jgi:glutamine amidotransferase